jgi:hypothetical protein
MSGGHGGRIVRPALVLLVGPAVEILSRVADMAFEIHFGVEPTELRYDHPEFARQ